MRPRLASTASPIFVKSMTVTRHSDGAKPEERAPCGSGPPTFGPPRFRHVRSQGRLICLKERACWSHVHRHAPKPEVPFEDSSVYRSLHPRAMSSHAASQWGRALRPASIGTSIVCEHRRAQTHTPGWHSPRLQLHGPVPPQTHEQCAVLTLQRPGRHWVVDVCQLHCNLLGPLSYTQPVTEQTVLMHA